MLGGFLVFKLFKMARRKVAWVISTPIVVISLLFGGIWSSVVLDGKTYSQNTLSSPTPNTVQTYSSQEVKGASSQTSIETAVLPSETPTPTPTQNPSPTAKPTLTPTVKPTPEPTSQPSTGSGSSNDNYYINSQGNTVHSPAYADSKPSGASAKCKDGTYSFSQNRRGTCSGHGGVAVWY
jgi:hypothetical protein